MYFLSPSLVMSGSFDFLVADYTISVVIRASVGGESGVK